MDGLGLKIGSKNLHLLVLALHCHASDIDELAVLICLLSRFGARNPLNIRVRDLVKRHRSIPNRGLVCSQGFGLQIGSQNTGSGAGVGAGVGAG